MSVFKRKSSGGLTQDYHYAFMIGGRRYRGVCDGCTTKEIAEDFEKERKKLAAGLAMQNSAKAVVENYRDILAGGSRIPLIEAWDTFTHKSRKKALATLDGELTKGGEFKLAVWRDFLAYLTAQHQDAETLNDITRQIADEYIQYLRTKGKFNKTVTFIPKGHRKTRKYELKKSTPSARTCNAYHITLTEIFDKLKDDSGLLENPFRFIDKMALDTESREPFTLKELEKIHDKADPFIYAIFMIGVHTGLREGDICTLQWSEIDLANGWINRKTLKTGSLIRVPILPDLRTWLEQLPHEGDYVLPDHAAMYLNNRTGIAWRVAKFLKDIELTSKRKTGTRSRAVSIKDVHSLRHTFVYVAAACGIPLPVVQSVIGHMTPAMTRHYANHADDQLKREKMAALPVLFGNPKPPALPAAVDDDRAALMAEVAELSKKADAAGLRRMIEAGKSCSTN